MCATRNGRTFFNLSFQKCVKSCMNTSTAVDVRMGRPRGFDEDAALEAAMRVFWEKSYEGATIADLTEAMGINRSSMYAAFGDKESIFRRVMERYRAGRMTYIRQALAQPSLREVVAELIHGTAEFLSSPDNLRLMIKKDSNRARRSLAPPKVEGKSKVHRLHCRFRSDGSTGSNQRGSRKLVTLCFGSRPMLTGAS